MTLRLLRRHIWYLIVPLCLWCLWVFLVSSYHASQRPKWEAVRQNASSNYAVNQSATFHDPAVVVDEHSLTALLPVTFETIGDLKGRLITLYEQDSRLHEIFVKCPRALAVPVIRIVSELAHKGGYPEIAVSVYEPAEEPSLNHYSTKISTKWTLVLNEQGLDAVDNLTQHELINPLALPVPSGLRGMYKKTCVISSDLPQLVTRLVPPFIIPTCLLKLGECFGSNGNVFAIEDAKNCGLVLPHLSSSAEWCNFTTNITDTIELWNSSVTFDTRAHSSETEPPNVLSLSMKSEIGTFGIILPTLRDLHLISPLLCHLQTHAFVLNIAIYADTEMNSAEGFDVARCLLPYEFIGGLDRDQNLARLARQLHFLEGIADIIIIPKGEFPLAIRPQISGKVVEIPRADFEYTKWMGSLTLMEWLNWNKPSIDISIITQNRPRSLARLLSSLSQGLYYGDNINVRVNLEQSSDVETMSLVSAYVWKHGSMSIYHRVVHGGLLPAVVESWYPHTNDTYALLLEDDVEVSPLFYAWIKMSILRYRYGNRRNKSPRLFGVSLYQQKNMELPIDGRHQFNAQELFNELDNFYSSTPYLSPVPCSWGAVYFPEHWREFHDYLAIRLSESSLDIAQNIVPNVRSNNWSKSWKKYFIELVFLRGYVMLYPNFDNYTSLSTNHLEIGSHVRHRTKEKQDLFLLPLMTLPQSPFNDIELLQLPNQTLPDFDILPVVNLTGSLTGLDELSAVGQSRRLELLNCTEESTLFDARGLMCMVD
ncbi:hypothetical protein AX17_003595 [Amanita inopinata Kibby_2008]|nr:hypothetical protein AX17_003595 [Amanita inopinata Kibby_2008]